MTSPGSVCRRVALSPTESGVDSLCQSEIDDLRMAARSDHQVRRLDVAVGDPFSMRLVERLGDLDGEVEDLGERKRLSGDLRVERGPLDVLHGDEGVALLRLADLVDHADVRMGKRRGGVRFLEETTLPGRVAREVPGEELDRHRTAERRVLGEIDVTHAARTELPHDRVVRNSVRQDALRFVGKRDYGTEEPGERPALTARCLPPCARSWKLRVPMRAAGSRSYVLSRPSWRRSRSSSVRSRGPRREPRGYGPAWSCRSVGRR
jgi:hypothetical protein